jgi:hypothetical protein
MLGDKIFNEKLKELHERQDKMIGYVSMTMEKQLLKAITDAMFSSLSTKDGIIEGSTANLDVLYAIDRVFDKFDKVYGGSLMNRLIDDFGVISQFNYDYFDLFRVESGVAVKRYNAINKEVDTWLRTSIGLNKQGKPTPNGYLDQLVNNKDLRDEIKTMTYDAVSGQLPIAEFTKGLQTKIEGSEDADGWLTKYYRGYAYDKYAEYDRANNIVYAKKLDLKWFIYAGGLIDDSREFCEERNNKVFNTVEAQDWKNDPTLPRTKAERESGNLEGYVPELNMGRWNCRHVVRWISDSLAKTLDPKKFAEFNK